MRAVTDIRRSRRRVVFAIGSGDYGFRIAVVRSVRRWVRIRFASCFRGVLDRRCCGAGITGIYAEIFCRNLDWCDEMVISCRCLDVCNWCVRSLWTLCHGRIGWPSRNEVVCYSARRLSQHWPFSISGCIGYSIRRIGRAGIVITATFQEKMPNRH